MGNKDKDNKSVNFCERANLRQVKLPERAHLWYQEDELKMIRRECVNAIKHSDDPNQYLRGLEFQLSTRPLNSSPNRNEQLSEFRKGIFQIQQEQRHDKIQSILAEYSCCHSRKAVERARNAAIEDAKVALDIYVETFFDSSLSRRALVSKAEEEEEEDTVEKSGGITTSNNVVEKEYSNQQWFHATRRKILGNRRKVNSSKVPKVAW